MRILILFALAALTCFCTENKPEKRINKTEVKKVFTERESKIIADTLNRESKKQNFKFAYGDFEKFYLRFISDSVFQMERIKFPIQGKYEDIEGERKWSKSKWPLIKWDLSEEINNSDDSISVIQQESKFFFGSYCKDCGFSYEMQFDKIKNEWFLTYRQENNL
ncbi:MAG: hypothetical protein ACXWW0_07620 [Bacteroidia bacterium]